MTRINARLEVGPSARDTLWQLIREMSREQLEEEVFRSEWKALTSRLRKHARLEGLDENQLALFEMHTALPPVIRITADNGDEDFIARDLASYRQIIDNELHTIEHHRRQVGIHERVVSKLEEWRDGQDDHFDEDAPTGPYIYKSVRCSICSEGWREDDPFELAHEVAIAAGGGENVVRLAHKGCNRAEGVG